jgi:hypothetical protein
MANRSFPLRSAVSNPIATALQKQYPIPLFEPFVQQFFPKKAASHKQQARTNGMLE